VVTAGDGGTVGASTQPCAARGSIAGGASAVRRRGRAILSARHPGQDLAEAWLAP